MAIAVMKLISFIVWFNNQRKIVLLKYFVLFAAVTTLSGCSVKPWQKEYLSKRQMSLEPDSVLVKNFKSEGYTGRAISKGGYSIGGGGCGCD